jgi:hypothetical protein
MTVIGPIETIEISGKKFKARIDTGARMSSIHKGLKRKLNLGPILRKTKVKSTHGVSIRPVIKSKIKIRNKRLIASFNLVDRRHMRYKILIGRNILKKGFLIDITK